MPIRLNILETFIPTSNRKWTRGLGGGDCEFMQSFWRKLKGSGHLMGRKWDVKVILRMVLGRYEGGRWMDLAWGHVHYWGLVSADCCWVPCVQSSVLARGQERRSGGRYKRARSICQLQKWKYIGGTNSVLYWTFDFRSMNSYFVYMYLVC